MKKIIAALFFALVLFVPAVYADVFDDNPARYFLLSTSDDGNDFFIDKKYIKHIDENVTKYVSITRLSNDSKLFVGARKLVSKNQIPRYVVSSAKLDCTGLRLKIGPSAIVGIDVSDDNLADKILWSDGSETDWTVIPNGIKPELKELLCSPSF